MPAWAKVDGVPTQAYTNTAKRLAAEDAKDADGKQLYVQVWDADANDGDIMGATTTTITTTTAIINPTITIAHLQYV